MKKFTLLSSAIVLASSLSQQAQADITVVDTGVPVATTSSFPLTLNVGIDNNIDRNIVGGQWLAAEFTTTQAFELDNIYGYINGGNTGDSFTVALYDSSFNSLTSFNASFTTDGWNGVSGINYGLAAGTYWVGFEVSANQTLAATMPVIAPTPALGYAWQDPSTNYGYVKDTGAAYKFGVQITAVPEPAMALLMLPGLLLVGRSAQRKAS